MASTSGVIVSFGESGSRQRNGDERVEGNTLEHPDESIEKQVFLS
jgi:hypothetical protein